MKLEVRSQKSVVRNKNLEDSSKKLEVGRIQIKYGQIQSWKDARLHPEIWF